jgi:hypothetical protein
MAEVFCTAALSSSAYVLDFDAVDVQVFNSGVMSTTPILRLLR